MRDAARIATIRTLITMAVLFGLAALAAADGTATCYMGQYTRAYTIFGEPTIDDGALSMQVDTGLWVTEASPCLIELEPAPYHRPAKVAASVVFCYDLEGEELLRHPTVDLAVVVDGALTWTRQEDGGRYVATLPCREIRGEP